LSLSSLSSWTSMRRRRATVPVATPGEWACGGSQWRMGQHFSNASCFAIVGGSAKRCVDQYMVLFRYCLLGGDTAMPGWLYASLYHAFLVVSSELLLRLERGAQYCNEDVCQFVCLSV